MNVIEYTETIMPVQHTKHRIERVRAKIAAGLLAAYLFGGGAGLAVGMKVGEYRTALRYAEHEAAMAQADRDNAEERVRQYKMLYRETAAEVAEQEAQTVILDEPEPGTYDAEFGWDFDYVVRVVGAEARGEPFEGMLAVAQCIKNTAERTGMTPEDVVKIPGQYSQPVGREVLDGMEMVNEACLQVFAKGAKATDEPIEFFYSTRGGRYSEWHEGSLRFVTQIGDHRFFARA